MHGEVFKDRSRNSTTFKMEPFLTTGNGRKLLRASSNMRHGSWIYPWSLRFSSLKAINFSTQYKYEKQTNFLIRSNQLFTTKSLITLHDFYSIITTIQFSVRKTTFYDKSSFFKIIGDAFRTEYVCSLSSYFTYWQIKSKIYSFFLLDLII